MVNNELIITDSRLLSKDEVMAIGVDNFAPLSEVPMPRAATITRGRLTITFSGVYNTSNGVSCNLTGTAHWMIQACILRAKTTVLLARILLV